MPVTLRKPLAHPAGLRGHAQGLRDGIGGGNAPGKQTVALVVNKPPKGRGMRVSAVLPVELPWRAVQKGREEANGQNARRIFNASRCS
jgi:hypothetical protein